MNESNELVADKTDYALHHGLQAIVCIGETLEQRESGELWCVSTLPLPYLPYEAAVTCMLHHVLYGWCTM